MKATLVGIALSAPILAVFSHAQAPVTATFGSGCGGVGGPPVYGSPTPALPGTNLLLQVANMQPLSTGGLMVGWHGQALPFALDHVGMT